ncbi:fluoride efflux transporter FluC [Microbacterium dextranolyticum]|uniref:Fluoride-specific ion channel FluC n=1 Tax=Microbacterium dextranolyticum TaxID=36806 RepID=A0A9W6HM80_9MICO|nr:CrcB family protein [Microbacterium dextranolyticum]MBM7464347.1 CrcB protein [Microbacterium dextranolyticum]GLJ95344.1 putative fluoride ion transporter CrcB [Microbacterium dextranolyticum]
MTPAAWIALLVGGGVGAGMRYLIDGFVMRGRKDVFPLGILLVNGVGSFLLGLVTGLGALVVPVGLAIIGVGVLGGFTTFSTVSVDTVLLARRGRRNWAWLNIVGTLLVCVAAATAGLMLGRLVAG